MSSPAVGTPSTDQHRKKKKKACRRCRTRKQRCDLTEPTCGNCASAGVECLPVVHEALEQVPVAYLRSLELHAANLERQLRERQQPGPAPDHLTPGQDPYLDIEPIRFLNTPSGGDATQWQFPQALDSNYVLPDARNEDLGLHSGFSPSQFIFRPLGTDLPDHTLTQDVATPPKGDEISPATGASFFQTYFQFIHPQYPFLNVQECGDWYLQWKMAPSAISKWPAFFVKMIFAIGSLIQSKSENATQFRHQDLKSQAQAEQSILTDSSSTPLIRMKAMLLSAMHALHSDSTWRIAHISGAIMKFASLYGFHELVDDGTEETSQMIKVWSCAYSLDRACSKALNTLVSLPDMYISTPLYEARPEIQYPMPWVLDCPPADNANVYPNLGTFAHICKIRLLQSQFMHSLRLAELGNSNSGLELQEQMLHELHEWEKPDALFSHSLMNTEGYQSALWLMHIGHLTRLGVADPTRATINSPMTDLAFKASCDACTSFRALQKKRQVAQPWLVVLSQFGAGVTLYYIIWARGIAVPIEADTASRDCTAVLAIFADRWKNAEHYLDCFECLARAISRSSPSEPLDATTLAELSRLTKRVEELGMSRSASRMLREICNGQRF